MKHRRKSHKGTIRVSKSGRRYKKSAHSKTGWVLVGKKKHATKRRATKRKRTTKRKHHAKRKHHSTHRRHR